MHKHKRNPTTLINGLFTVTKLFLEALGWGGGRAILLDADQDCEIGAAVRVVAGHHGRTGAQGLPGPAGPAGNPGIGGRYLLHGSCRIKLEHLHHAFLSRLASWRG